MAPAARLRAWLDASLANRMAWAAGTLALGFSLFLTLVAFVSIGALLARQLDQTVRAKAIADARLGAGALSAAVERVRELARHSMVINGLVDSSGRQAYLVPFIEQDPLRARLDGTLVICDAAGDAVVSAGRAPKRTLCSMIPPDASKYAPQLTEVAVTQESGELFLDVRNPITMPATGTVKGMIIGRASVRRILEEAGVWNEATLLGIELDGLREETGRDEGRMFRVDETAPLAARVIGRSVALRLFHAVPIEPLYLPAAAILLVFVVTLCVLIPLVAYLARRQAARLSVPLIRLKEAAARVTEGEPVRLDPVLVRHDEIGSLATAVKSMADTLRGHGAALEVEVERRTAELLAAKEATERVNLELESFAYSVAHDLKAPLRGIDGYSSLLLRGYADRLDDTARGYLARVRTAAVNMGLLIDELLAYSRLEQRPFASTEVDVAALVDAVIAERETEIRDCGVRLSVALAGPSILNCDREGLALILRNLLGNALKFSRGGPAPGIEVGSRETSRSRILWMRDNGVGFDMRFHDKIFDMFARLNRTEDYPGTGVGLAMVRKAVSRMGGRVWAESAPGRGAVFYVELPK